MSTPSSLSRQPAWAWRLTWPLLALAATALVLLVYWNGMQGPFILDDRTNILMVPGMALSELTLRGMLDAMAATGSAYPDRPLARLSFALNHYFSGGYDVLDMKLTSVFVHLGNAALIWLLSLRLLARHAARGGWQGVDIAGRPWWQWAAFLAAVLWAVHPLHVSTVLYIVQRMTSLSSLFVLLGLLVFVIGRERLESDRRSGWVLMWGGMTGGVLLGALCKENAILLPFFVALVELVFFEREPLPKAVRRRLLAFYGLTVMLPGLLALGALAWKWDHFSGNYWFRPYTLEERVLTQLRVLWFYLGLMALPDVRSYGVFQDDFPLSQSLLDPWTTALALVAWLVVVALALAGLRRRSLFSFAVLWYLIGHAIESSVLSLEMAFEHRNYLPSVGPVIAFAAALVAGLGHLLGRPRAVVAVAVLVVVTCSGVGFTRANIWESMYMLNYFGARNHPDSPRYRRAWAAMLSEDRNVDKSEVFVHLQAAARLQPQDITSLYDMARFVDQRLYRQQQPPAWDDGSVHPDSAPVDPLAAPLTQDVGELRGLALAIDRELSRRAREGKLLVSSAEIGRHMSRCMNTADAICARMLEPAIRWTGLIGDSPRLFPEPRAITKLAYAKLQAFTGDIDGAVASIGEAEQLLPDDVNFRFQKAALMMALGRLEDAKTALDEAEARINWTGSGTRSLQALREELRMTRERAAAGATRVDATGARDT